MSCDILATEQRLPKGKERLVYGENVIFLAVDEVFHDDVHFVAVRDGVTGSSDKVLCIVKIEFQGHGEGESRGLAWLIGGIVAYFREQLAVNICPFVHIRIGLALGIDKAKKCFRESVVYLAKQILQPVMSLRTIFNGMT